MDTRSTVILNTPRDASRHVAGSTHDLFLSFASEHTALVEAFRRQATSRLSLLSFDDCSTSTVTGSAWKHHAEELIRSCRATLCLVGSSTYQSGPVDWEIRKSIDLGKRVLAVYLEPTTILPAALLEIGISPLPLIVDVVLEQLT